MLDKGIDGKALLKVTDDQLDSLLTRNDIETKSINRMKRTFKRELQ